eukprot:UN32593
MRLIRRLKTSEKGKHKYLMETIAEVDKEGLASPQEHLISQKAFDRMESANSISDFDKPSNHTSRPSQLGLSLDWTTSLSCRSFEPRLSCHSVDSSMSSDYNSESDKEEVDPWRSLSSCTITSEHTSVTENIVEHIKTKKNL